MWWFACAPPIEFDPVDGSDSVVAEACADGVDNDADMLVDCVDPDCDGTCPEACDDVRDNDGDGLVDCADLDCTGQCAEDCGNGRDDDGDGRADCSDTQCVLASCPELCGDGRDNDADGLVDCLDPGCDGGCPEECSDGRDNDGDGLLDCADANCEGLCAEACVNGLDDDGDGLVDCFDPECGDACDVDGDGHVSSELGGDDCDDLLPQVHPGASEDCNGFDDDCDGLVDAADPELDPAELTWWYADADGDGFGSTEALLLCLPPDASWVVNDDDCDDARSDVHPASDEICNGVDDECDGLVDDLDPSVDLATGTVWYPDTDGDGFGVPTDWLVSCAVPDGFDDDALDCDDADPDVFPTDWLIDADADGFGAGDAVYSGLCEAPADGLARSSVGLDCADDDPTISPASDETCDDLVDQDCDGRDAPCTRELLAVRTGSYWLVAIDLATFKTRDIGSLGVPFWYGGITWDPVAETVYMVDGDATSNLWTVDPYTAATTLVGNMGTIRNFSIAWDPDRSTLWVAASTPQGLHEVDPMTGASRHVGPLPGLMDGLTWDSDRGTLVGWLGGAGDVFEIDRDTAASTLLFDGEWVNNGGFVFDPVEHAYWAVDLTSSLYLYEDDPWRMSVPWLFPQAYDGLAWVGDALVDGD